MEQKAERNGAGGSAHKGKNMSIRCSPVGEKNLSFTMRKITTQEKTLELDKYKRKGTGVVTILDKTIWHRSEEERNDISEVDELMIYRCPLCCCRHHWHPCTHTHTRTHARTHAHTHTHTHTHTKRDSNK